MKIEMTKNGWEVGGIVYLTLREAMATHRAAIAHVHTDHTADVHPWIPRLKVTDSIELVTIEKYTFGGEA